MEVLFYITVLLLVCLAVLNELRFYYIKKSYKTLIEELNEERRDD